MTVKSKSQIDKFRETARNLEADEDESKFNDALKRVANAPPPKDEPKSGKREA
jgi:hypothetical protein